jgi:hypothetical protein
MLGKWLWLKDHRDKCTFEKEISYSKYCLTIEGKISFSYSHKFNTALYSEAASWFAIFNSLKSILILFVPLKLRIQREIFP